MTIRNPLRYLLGSIEFLFDTAVLSFIYILMSNKEYILQIIMGLNT